MAPELKLGALLDDTLVTLRNRGRELPDLPKDAVFAEDDAVDAVTVAEAAAVMSSLPAGGGSTTNHAKSNKDLARPDRHTKKRATVDKAAAASGMTSRKMKDADRGAGGSRKDRARADKRGYVPSRSKRGGGGAYGWGAAPSAAELIEWEVRECVRLALLPCSGTLQSVSKRSVVRRVARAG